MEMVFILNGICFSERREYNLVLPTRRQVLLKSPAEDPTANFPESLLYSLAEAKKPRD
jgi:hypothetical protein